MLAIFQNHIQKFTALNPETFEQVISYFEVQAYKKKAIVSALHDPQNYHYFVLSGCLRMFTVHEKGHEITTDFALETWWLADQKAYQSKLNSDCAIQAIESTTLIRINKEKEDALCQEFPVMQSYFLQVYKKAFAAAQYRNMLFKLYSKEEIYLQFNQNFPGFVQRVPQYLLASYLGVTPEYLSEIRRKSIS